MLNDVPRRPVISNCGAPTENISAFLDHRLQLITKAGKSYINLLNISSNAILVTADVVGLYSSIPHDADLQALYEKLEERTDKKIPSTDLAEMAQFILECNFFEFDTKIIQKILRTAIGTKLSPPYACLFMDIMENNFLESEMFKL